MQNALMFTEDEFFDRLSMFTTEGSFKRHMPRKRKNVSDGTCPCCGKPCAPFTTCKEYRDLQTIGHYLREEVKAGRVRVVGRDGRELIYEKTEEGEAYYRELSGQKLHVRHQGSKERERNLKRMANG